MKRILSVIMICALLVVGLATLAFAESGVASLGITAEKVNDQVVAKVKLNDYTDKSWSAMTTVVNYDSSLLQLVDVEDQLSGDYEGGLTWDSTVPGKIYLVWVGDAIPADDDKVIAVLTFEIQEVTEAKSVELSVGFLAEGMAEAGETDTMDNGQPGEDKIYSSEPEVLPEENEDIVIYPEGQEPGEEPDEPVVPTPSKQTIYSTTEPNNKVYFNIGASYKEGGTVPVYKVNVTWDNGDIKFTAEGKEWAPSEHDWAPIGTPETAAKWEGTGSIKMENHSCEDVNVTFKYTPNGNDTVMEFKKDGVLVPETGISIEASAETEEGQEVTPPGKAEVEVAIVSGTITDGENIGKIVVKIA